MFNKCGLSFLNLFFCVFKKCVCHLFDCYALASTEFIKCSYVKNINDGFNNLYYALYSCLYLKKYIYVKYYRVNR